MAIIKTVEGKTPRYAGWDRLGDSLQQLAIMGL